MKSPKVVVIIFTELNSETVSAVLLKLNFLSFPAVFEC